VDRGTLYLFDTSVLLALVRGGELGRYINNTFGLSEVINKPLISVVSHGEIWALAERNGWGDKKREALSEMLSVDRKNLAHPQGARALSDNDKWIAATARAAGAVLLTTDQDFIHLNPDVCLVHYVDPSSRLPASAAGTQTKLP